MISLFLEKHNIKYTTEKRFIGCADKGPLRFDFFLPEYGMCIEYDGLQHYEPITWFDRCFEDQIRRDRIKTKFCEENDIPLLRIKYDELNQIGDILSDWLIQAS